MGENNSVRSEWTNPHCIALLMKFCARAFKMLCGGRLANSICPILKEVGIYSHPLKVIFKQIKVYTSSGLQGVSERAVAREIWLENTNQALGSARRVIVIFLFLLFFFCFCHEKSKLKKLQGHLCQVTFVKLKAVWSRKAVLPAAKKMQRSRVSRESESSLKVLRRPIH